MDLLIPIVLLLVVGALVLLLVRQRSNQRAAAEPARKKGGNSREALDTVIAWPPQATRILTAPERKAYSALRSALPEHIILAQVPLSRFMKVPTRNSYSEWLRRVGLMSVDMVVCDASSQVIGVVDIRAGDGKENLRARQRHARMDRVLEAAGIPVHVWLDNAIPSPTMVRETILGKPRDVEAPQPGSAAARMQAPLADVQNPVEPEALLEAEEQRDALAHRDPPPSTWFDNLDSDAMPLNAGPAAAPSARATASTPR